VYLVIGDGITLIETATTLIAPTIVEAAAEIGFEEAERQLEVYHHFILSRLEQGLGTRQIAAELADLYLEDALNPDLREREDHGQFLRSMMTSIVIGYETHFRRSGKLS
jgi:hypothetical protein